MSQAKSGIAGAILMIEQMIAQRQRRIDAAAEEVRKHFDRLRTEMMNIEYHPLHMTPYATLRSEWSSLEYDLDAVQKAGLEISYLDRALSVLRETEGTGG